MQKVIDQSVYGLMKNEVLYMKKYLFIVLLVGVWSCEEKDEDNSPPAVIITSPSNQS